MSRQLLEGENHHRMSVELKDRSRGAPLLIIDVVRPKERPGHSWLAFRWPCIAEAIVDLSPDEMRELAAAIGEMFPPAVAYEPSTVTPIGNAFALVAGDAGSVSDDAPPGVPVAGTQPGGD